MATGETRRINDLDTLKAFGHPLRMKLYRALFIARTSTASQLADQLDETVALVSYHLRKLGSHGLIEEAPGQTNDGRERWWRVTSAGVSARDEDFQDAPESLAAHIGISRLAFHQRNESYERYLDEQAAWDQQWRSAAFSLEYLPRLTAEELRQLGEELHAVVDKWEAHGRAAETAGANEGRENIALHLYGFPFRS